MLRNRLLFFIFLIACSNPEKTTNCQNHTLVLTRYSDKQPFEISFCIDDTLKETLSISLSGTRMSKEFKNATQECYIGFSDAREDIIIDSLYQKKVIHKGYNMLGGSKLLYKEIIDIDSNTKGIYSVFKKDSLYLYLFDGYNKEFKIDFNLINKTAENEQILKKTVHSLKFIKI